MATADYHEWASHMGKVGEIKTSEHKAALVGFLWTGTRVASVWQAFCCFPAFRVPVWLCVCVSRVSLKDAYHFCKSILHRKLSSNTLCHYWKKTEELKKILRLFLFHWKSFINHFHKISFTSVITAHGLSLGTVLSSLKCVWLCTPSQGWCPPVPPHTQTAHSETQNRPDRKGKLAAGPGTHLF